MHFWYVAFLALILTQSTQSYSFVSKQNLISSPFISLQSNITYHAFVVVPPPLPVDAPAGLFAEGRALATTSFLADTIGHRQVSTPGEEKAAKYLLSQAKRIAIDARQHRPDLHVLVEREYVSGALSTQHVFGFEIANVYNGLTNIVLRIAPTNHKESETENRPRSVLVNAHYDSTIGSPGASDAASCVGIALEMARTIVANASLPLSSPIIFLFNGGEETLMQASHGFMATSPFAKELGAFINLESTGPWGPDVVFQHTGDWTLRAYARTAPAPRGTTVGQDLFELGVIPADTDYRMFSYRHYGAVPGIDVAFLFDGTAYHSNRDETSRIRPGTLQAMGENMLATALEFSRVLSTGDYRGEQHVHIPKEKDIENEENEEVVTGIAKSPRGHVFFDILSTYMVVYSHHTASFLHQIPLLLLLTLSLQTAARKIGNLNNSGASAVAASGARPTSAFDMVFDDQEQQQIQSTSKVPPPGPLLRHAGIALISILCSILMPAIIGGARAVILQTPIFWYSNHRLAHSMYIPAAIAGILLPYAIAGSGSSSTAGVGLSATTSSVAGTTNELSKASARSLGCALLFSLFASALTSIGVNSAYLFAAWALGAIAAVVLAPATNKTSAAYTWRHVVVLVLCFIPPITVSLPTALSIATHVMEKIGLAGAPPGRFGAAVPDIAVGALTGVGLVVATGTLIPYIAAALGKQRAKMVITLLLGTSIVVAAFGGGSTNSTTFLGRHIRTLFSSNKTTLDHPYSYRSPKRVIIQHFHRHTQQGSVYDSFFTFSSMDAVPVEVSLPESAMNLPYAPYSNADWVALYPINYLVTGTARKAPRPPRGYKTPSLKLITADEFYSGVAGGSGNSVISNVWNAVKNLVPGAASAPEQEQHSSKNESGGSSKRIYLQLDTVRSAWAVMNITVDLSAWSLGSDIAVANRKETAASGSGSGSDKNSHAAPSQQEQQHVPEQHMVRYASGTGTRPFKFWLEPKQENSKINIELFVKHLEPSPAAQQILDSMADWTSPAAVTTWHSTWEF